MSNQQQLWRTYSPFKIQTASKEGIRKIVNRIMTRDLINKTLTTVMKWRKRGIGVSSEQISQSAKCILKLKIDNRTKERILRLNSA